MLNTRETQSVPLDVLLLRFDGELYSPKALRVEIPLKVSRKCVLEIS